jgi:hypothetical protein
MRLYVPDPPQEKAYPIVTLTWILVYRHYGNDKTAAELQDLFRWCLTDGQQLAASLGYTPLPARLFQHVFGGSRFPNSNACGSDLPPRTRLLILYGAVPATRSKSVPGRDVRRDTCNPDSAARD